ncbi:MAG: radical SAM protein [Candidatus Adiutrix sp.]|jgi:radical SAM protein with 4Fe4S-binding SPASM domain|nr:radical SAM protein [Candidatus Adiutrix sp.]
MAAAVPPPRLVAWETTRACNLACRHCRAEAVPQPPAGELSPGEGRDFLDQLAAWAPAPGVILSGGEPLLRPDILDLAAYGRARGLRMLLSTNGTLLDAPLARALKAAGVARVSLSLDHPDATGHDAFRGAPGAFDGTQRGAAHLRAAGLPFQINSTLTAGNLDQAEALTDLARELGAVAHHVFLLVPVGRAAGLEEPLTAGEYEAALKDIHRREAELPLEFKATCAPQYQRLSRESGRPVRGRGCLAGQGFLFFSSFGEARGCGYLTPAAGNFRLAPVRDIYERAPLFLELRDRTRYRGRCGVCEYWSVCGGCRARAQAAGDYLGPEPLCPHQPRAWGERPAGP